MKIIPLFILIFLFSFVGESFSKNTSDYQSVICFRTSEFDKNPVLYTCNSPFCRLGYNERYKKHKYCESDNYSEVFNHRIFGQGQLYLLCTKLLGVGKGNDKCNLPLE